MTSTRTPRGRTIALVAAVGVVAVAAVAAARWEQLATRYYLWRLESDEEYLEQLVDSPELGMAHKALREFCQRDEGAAALLGLFVSHIVAQNSDFIEIKVYPDAGAYSVWDGKVHFYTNAPPQGIPLALMDAEVRDRLQRVHDFLKSLDGRKLTLDCLPTHRVEVGWASPDSKTTLLRVVRITPDTDGQEFTVEQLSSWRHIEEWHELESKKPAVRIRVDPDSGSPQFHHHDPPP